MWEGHSCQADARQAVAEATEGWPRDNPKLDLVLAFASTQQEPRALAHALRERFGTTPTVGCTTSGEHLDGERHRGSLMLTGLQTPTIRFATAVARDLPSFRRKRRSLRRR